MLPSRATIIRANPLLASYQTLLVVGFIVVGSFLVFSVVTIIAVIIPGPGSAAGLSPSRLHLFLVLFVIIAVIMIITMLTIFLSPLGVQKIEVTEQGVRVRYGGQKSFVGWEEVRLFAVYNTWGVPRWGSSLSYELSSATAIARWNWIRHPNFFSMSAAGVPPGEYQQQMYALNELIAARTGLPLFDLRKESERPV